MTIVWYKIVNDTKTMIQHDETKYILSSLSNRTLQIKNPRLDDQGKYQCEATLAPTYVIPAVESANLVVYGTFSRMKQGSQTSTFNLNIYFNFNDCLIEVSFWILF